MSAFWGLELYRCFAHFREHGHEVVQKPAAREEDKLANFYSLVPAMWRAWDDGTRMRQKHCCCFGLLFSLELSAFRELQSCTAVESGEVWRGMLKRGFGCVISFEIKRYIVVAERCPK